MSKREYPTEEELQRIRDWALTDARGWMEYCRSLWWQADWGWPELVGEVSTGGWSGNESIIDAMQDASILWMQVWEQTRRGGHYTFSLEYAVPVTPLQEKGR